MAKDYQRIMNENAKELADEMREIMRERRAARAQRRREAVARGMSIKTLLHYIDQLHLPTAYDYPGVFARVDDHDDASPASICGLAPMISHIDRAPRFMTGQVGPMRFYNFCINLRGIIGSVYPCLELVTVKVQEDAPVLVITERKKLRIVTGATVKSHGEIWRLILDTEAYKIAAIFREHAK